MLKFWYQNVLEKDWLEEQERKLWSVRVECEGGCCFDITLSGLGTF